MKSVVWGCCWNLKIKYYRTMFILIRLKSNYIMICLSDFGDYKKTDKECQEWLGITTITKLTGGKSSLVSINRMVMDAQYFER